MRGIYHMANGSNCGNPLVPSLTECPRCGAAIPRPPSNVPYPYVIPLGRDRRSVRYALAVLALAVVAAVSVTIFVLMLRG